ncbi:FAD/NAD(P)-binding domain-containing protein [Coniochaeta ligniaria NRRL 30616]|uniref:FAD/NAD(P)-binding domain-containing protein n=1 Tax=Coniochaeta ligniaria NRRL 30616 TaxID=1408157 RepID=A0A1J7K602_9PEZI|nr:FAD/NAD(P)-binding domain-containing protein [Coniochaeta ligniaria NRRL 30616]
MLDVVIVGAGVAGLTAGFALRRAGHRVRIYERSGMNNEVGAAINVPPNAARLLLAWGLDPETERFVTAQSILIAVGATLDVLDLNPVGDRVAERYGRPFYLAHRVDLHDALKRMATGEEGPGEPVRVMLRSEVVAYDAEAPSITLSNGEIITGDVVIAADGLHSIAVETVLGHANPPQPQELYNGCLRFLIPAADIEADPAARWWNEGSDGQLRVFMNGKAGTRLVSYPCRNNEVHNFVSMFHSEELKTARREDWHAAVDKSQMVNLYLDFHPKIMAVLKKATDVKRWPLLFRPPVKTWRRSKMVIAGDAAHPMLPHQGQGGAQGIEDGVALGIALCGATADEVEDRLEIYEKVRRNRASAIQILSNAGVDQIQFIAKEIKQYTDRVPKNVHDIHDFLWDHDVVAESVKAVQERYPGFQLPSSFFEGSLRLSKPSGP